VNIPSAELKKLATRIRDRQTDRQRERDCGMKGQESGELIMEPGFNSFPYNYPAMDRVIVTTVEQNHSRCLVGLPG